MKHESKLNSQQQQQHTVAQQASSQTVREFATPEELLRHDAAGTPVPPAIAQRLQESIGSLPPPTRPWWRRLFKDSNS